MLERCQACNKVYVELFIVTVYKPNKAPGLWRYSVERNRKQDDYIITAYLTAEGWSDSSQNIEQHRTEAEAETAGKEATKNEPRICSKCKGK